MRRALNLCGIVATRESGASHFYPHSLDLDRLWTGNLRRELHKGEADVDFTGTRETWAILQLRL